MRKYLLFLIILFSFSLIPVRGINAIPTMQKDTVTTRGGVNIHQYINLTVGRSTTVNPWSVVDKSTDINYNCVSTRVYDISDYSALNVTTSSKTSTSYYPISSNISQNGFYETYSIKALKPGSYRVTCYVHCIAREGYMPTIWIDGDYFIHYHIEVKEKPKVTSISIPETMTLTVGESYTFKPVILEEGATTTLSWNSSNSSVISVDKGKIKAISQGTAVVTCTATNGVSASCQVTVNPVLVNSITLNHSELNINKGEKIQLYASILPENATNKDLKWSSDNENVAFVGTDGTVIGVSNGYCNITATAKDGSDKYAGCIVHVNSPITIKVKSCTRKYGESNTTFDYMIEGGTLSGTPSITCDATPSSPVGEYEIQISRGSIKNEQVIFLNGTLTITKAPLTATAKSYIRKQGEENPELEIEYAGFRNGEDESVLDNKPTAATDAVPESVPGNYEIRLTGGSDDNYDITMVDGTMTVTEADKIVVSANKYTRVYGEDNPQFGYTTSGGTLAGIPVLTCEATADSPVGTYPIRISKGSVTNYNVEYVEGTLTITKAPLTATAKSYTRKQGEENPELEIEYAGFRNGEDESVLDNKPTAATDAVPESAPGNYEIRLTGGSDDNYDITMVDGTMTVTELPLTIVVAKDYTRVYGDDNPSFEYTISYGELNGIPEIYCDATPSSPVGIYPIKIRRGSVTNSKIEFVEGFLRITKAPLTATACSYTKEQGDENPHFNIVYEGFKNEETEDQLISKPTIITTATKDSEIGEYAIHLHGGYAQNYEVTCIDGILKIVKPSVITKEINNSTAGLINNILSNDEKGKITKLKVSGELNGTDIRFIREMIISGRLVELDIENALIVEGGEPYYGEGILSCYTKYGEIGENMFYNCENLISVLLPSSVKKIRCGAFNNCNKIRTLQIPDNCEEVDFYAICYCNSLESVILSPQTRLFDADNCVSCPNLKSIEVSNNIWYESNQGILFSKGQSELIKYPMGRNEQTYEIPTCVTSISEHSFEGNLYVEEIKIPNTVKNIGDFAFSNCKKLSKIVLPNDIDEIGGFLLSNCENLTEVTIPANVSIIGTWAFWNCSSLSNIICNISDISAVKANEYTTGNELDAFEGTSKYCTWHIPEGTKNNYLAQSWWIPSWEIVEDIPSGIENITSDKYEISWNEGLLTIQANHNIIINIYTINGMLLHSLRAKKGTSYYIKLPRGIYILNNKKMLFK